MAKRAMQWDTNTLTVTLTANDEVDTALVLSNPEGGLSPGRIWINRFMGSVLVLVDGYISGSNLIVWHGLVLKDGTMPTPAILQPDGGDDEANQGAWLWREPINLFPTATPMNINDFIVQEEFDWAIRGGKGSYLSNGAEFHYVVQLKSQAPPAEVKVVTTFLALFAGS